MASPSRVLGGVASAWVALALWFAGASVVRAAPADEAELGDGTRVSGTLEVSCTPDEKSAMAGAQPFDDTVTLADDRVLSKVLAERGFPEALAIPKTVNGVITMNVVFEKKRGGKATYALRIKDEKDVRGSLTVNDRNGRARYVVRSKGAAEAEAEGKPESESGEKAGRPGKGAGGQRGGARGKGKAKGAGEGDAAGAGKPARGGDGAAADPAVLRADGGFVRLMTADVALAEARVTDKAKKARVARIQEAAGTDWQALKGTYLSGAITPAEYADAAGRRLAEANAELAEALGDRGAADLDAAYAKPAASAFLYHNALRAALAELEPAGAAARAAADKAVYRRMLELAARVRKPDGREPAALEKFQAETDAEVKKALPAAAWARVRETVDGLTAYEPEPATEPPPPIELE